MKNIAFLFTYFLSSFMNAQGVEKNEIILKGIEANNYIFDIERSSWRYTAVVA